MKAEYLEILLAQCVLKNRKAQHELYSYCFPILMRICSRYYKNEEDARSSLNLSFLKILNHLEKKQESIQLFDAWIKKIMINTIIDEHRRNSSYNKIVQLNASHKDYDDGYDGIDWNDAEDKLDADSLLKLVHALPKSESRVFNLYAIDGYKHSEIAEMLEIPMGTSKWLLSAARVKLRKQVELLMGEKIVLK